MEQATAEAARQLSQANTALDTSFRLDLDQVAIEDVVELKIAKFLEQIDVFYPENLYEMFMAKVEKPLLVQVMRRCGGNQVHAAKVLGINRNTLRKKIKQYNLC